MPPSPPLSLDALLLEVSLSGSYLHRRIEAGEYVEALAQLTVTERHIAEVRRRVHALAAADGVETGMLTNCGTCAWDEGRICGALYGSNQGAVRAWWADNGDGTNTGCPKPGSTGCPGHKARQ